MAGLRRGLMTDSLQLTAFLRAQRKLRRVEGILQTMTWRAKGVNDPYSNWLRGQLRLALELEEEKPR